MNVACCRHDLSTVLHRRQNAPQAKTNFNYDRPEIPRDAAPVAVAVAVFVFFDKLVPLIVDVQSRLWCPSIYAPLHVGWVYKKIRLF